MFPRRCTRGRWTALAAGETNARSSSSSSSSSASPPRGVNVHRRLFLGSVVATGVLTAYHDDPTTAAAVATAAKGGGKRVSRPETVVYIALTMDGYIARTDGDIDFLPTPSDPNEDYGFAAFLDSVDAILMGRKTYEQAVGFVMADTGAVPWPYEGKMVTVVSSTLRQEDVPAELSGKVVVSNASPAETLRNMKKKSTSTFFGSGVGDTTVNNAIDRVYVDGGRTIRSLLEDDEIDEMVLTTVPVLIGRGVTLFGFDAKRGHEEQGGAAGDYEWKHVSTMTYPKDGLVKTTYSRVR